jgi:hypothetical protein
MCGNFPEANQRCHEKMITDHCSEQGPTVQPCLIMTAYRTDYSCSIRVSSVAKILLDSRHLGAFRMKRTIATTFLILTVPGLYAAAQGPMFIGPGSTVEGDYLRGVGVASYGIGLGNLYNAQATAINVDTAIRLNEYIAAVLKNENAENAAHRHAKLQREHDAYNKMRERIFKEPEALDVDKGSSLNALLEKMNEGRIQESAHRYADVTIPADIIKKIPFKLGEKGVGSFSMHKLTMKDLKSWPLAFQDPQFDLERRKYFQALDKVLEEHEQQAARIESINRLERAVEALSTRLGQAKGLDPSERRFIEASQRVRDLRKTVEMLKLHKIQTILADLDRYEGKNVDHLRAFMRTHNLQFAAAESVEERDIFPKLYEKLKFHYEKVSSGQLDEKNN